MRDSDRWYLRMHAPTFFLTVCSGLLLLLPGLCAAQLTTRPNMVFILVDNWGWGDVGVQGSAVPTPMIDGLAGEGVRFTNYNVESESIPTRSAIHTGRLPIRSGTQHAGFGGRPYGLAPWEFTVAELLADAGYDTALHGQWHLGDNDGRLPTDQGYDKWFGIKNGANEAGYAGTVQYDPAIVPQPYIWEGAKGQEETPVMPFDLESCGQLDQMIVERSIEYIKQHAAVEESFFLFIGFTGLNPPLAVHPYFVGKSGAGVYSDGLLQLDYHVGMILQAISDAGLEEETIVILTGDNGTIPTIAGGGSNGPYRGGFGGFEGGLRTVAMMRWPGKIRPGRVTDHIIACLDWFPTLAAFAGAQQQVPTDRPIDGIDQSGLILGDQETSSREYVIRYIGEEIISVKWRNFKVHLKTIEELHGLISNYHFPLVYDVKNDPGEQVELMRSQGFSYSWVLIPVQRIIADKQASMIKFPNIKPGEEFKGYE